MNTGSRQYHHNRHVSSHNRRDSPSSKPTSTSSSTSSRPRSNSKTFTPSESQRPKPSQANSSNCNGKTMPSVSSSPADSPIMDGVATPTLDNCKYPIGSKITVKLANGTVNKGEVIAYDPNIKIVMLKSSGSKQGANDVTMINLAQCSEVKIDDEAKTNPAELPSINTPKLTQRLRDNIDRKKKLMVAFKAGIAPEGHKLFQTISKTIDEIWWNGDKIVVMKDVTIEPPYRSDTIRGNPENIAVQHVRKIVEKHIDDQQAARASSEASQPPLTASSTADSHSTGSHSSAGARAGGRPNRNSGPSKNAGRHNNNNNNSDHHTKPMYNQ